MKLFVYIAFFTFIYPNDKVWPTNASHTLTTTFAEERPYRYHSGIDVRTYGKNGFELYAIDDGYISRIRTSSKGYGKTIYLRLNDGYTAVYAHMETFTPKVNKIVSKLQKQYNSYTIDHFLSKDEISFKKGAVIGYTGDTGTISGPHLHFEIRNEKGNPINPLQYGMDLKDTMSPIPISMAFIPQNTSTLINGYNHYILKEFKKINTDEYSIVDTISIIGDFNLALNVVDKLDGQPFTYGVYSIDLFINDSLSYSILYDEYDFSESNLIYEERDLGLKINGHGKFYRLFSNQYTKNLSFVKESTNINLSKSSPKYHDIKIIVTDFYNNSITINATTCNIEIPKLSVSKDLNDMTLSINYDYESNYINNARLINSYFDSLFIDANFNINDTNLITITNYSEPYDIFAINIKDKETHLKSSTQYINLKDKEQPINIDGNFLIEQYPYGIKFKFIENYFSDSQPVIVLEKNNKLFKSDVSRINPHTLISKTFHPSELLNINSISILYNTTPNKQIRKKLYGGLFYPKKPLKLQYDLGKVQLSFNGTEFRDTTFIFMDIDTLNILDGYNIIMGPYEISPTRIPAIGKFEIQFRVSDKSLLKHSRIYKLSGKKDRWNYIDTETVNNQILKSFINQGGYYAVIHENEPPNLKNIKPYFNTKYYSKDLKTITFNVNDEISGIDGEKNIVLKLNNNPVIFEFNSYQKKVLYQLENQLTIGTHSLEIIATDNANNIIKKEGMFTIK